MKVERISQTPPPPPDLIVITLSVEEARQLRTLVADRSHRGSFAFDLYDNLSRLVK